jgi:hypothetical protein
MGCPVDSTDTTYPTILELESDINLGNEDHNMLHDCWRSVEGDAHSPEATGSLESGGRILEAGKWRLEFGRNNRGRVAPSGL